MPRNEETSNLKFYFGELSDEGSIKPVSNFSTLKRYIEEQSIFEDGSTFKIKDVATENFDDLKKKKGIIILFAYMRHLHNKKIYIELPSMIEGKIRTISDFKSPFNAAEPTYFPIILVGLEDITQNDALEDPIINKLNLDPRFLFWDSNIWHRYIPLNENFDAYFKLICREVVENYNLNLYKTTVAGEFLEFQSRMMVNSFLAPIGRHGHATNVTPYKFHSETLMENQKEREKESLIKGIKWKFLLVDDFATKPLSCTDIEQQDYDHEITECFEEGTLTKACLLQKLIRKFLDSDIEIYNWKGPNSLRYENIKGNVLVCVKSVEKALQALENEMFDIIFLDYLLGETNLYGKREYGSMLLKIIKDRVDKDKNLEKNKGPLKRFWIFPISAFTYAMLDELREQGITHLSEHWHLASGADPVCTPHLFTYKLHQFMNMQIKEVNHYLHKTLKEKFGKPPDRDKDYVPSQAKTFYSDFVQFHGQYRSLIKDSGSPKSKFAETMRLLLEERTPSALWEHFHNLVYLLAYGTGIEWPEMWEEYSFIKYKLQTHDRDASAEVQVPLQNIRDYIISLQKQFK